jgi:hypothetical protein
MSLTELMNLIRYFKLQPEVGLGSMDWIPFVYSPLIKEILQRKSIDNIDFATALYAYDLFAQSLFSNFHIYLGDENFPGVCGILSSIDTRVCPALLPTQILYEQVGSRHSEGPNIEKEREVWRKNRHFFNEKVNAVAVETIALIRIYAGVETEQQLNRNHIRRWQGGKILLDAVQEKFVKEHQSLDARLCLGIALGRRCAGNNSMEEKGFHYLDLGTKIPLQLHTQGMLVSEIAELMEISEDTVLRYIVQQI